MKKGWELTQEAFESLLGWLDSDREQAAEKYETIKQRLIRIFASRGCAEAEDLADETINRVAYQVPELVGKYVGDPALYFYGTARKVVGGYWTASPLPPPPPPPSPDEQEEKERRDRCLSECLATLKPGERELLLRYYRYEKQAKIECHRTMAEELGISDNALKIRVYRLRERLHTCMTKCVEK